MRKRTVLTYLLLTTALLLIHTPQYGQKILSDWDIAKRSDNIEISYRNVRMGDTLKTRQMKMTFMVASNPETLIEMFKRTDKLSAWSAGAEKCNVFDITANTWMTYTLYDIPWPFNQKDLVTQYKMVRGESSIVLKMNAAPQYLPKNKEISRVENYEGKWTLADMGNGNTRVEFLTISFTKPIIPRFIQDPIIQNVLINSANKLKELAQQQEIAVANRFEKQLCVNSGG